MNAERWQRIEELFLGAIGEAPAKREGVLTRGCGGDAALLSDVQRMLAAHERASSFIESPAFDTAPREDGLSLHGQDARATIGAGQRIGRYSVRRVLGAGGMGVVYEAEQDEPRRFVALKVVRALPLVDDLTPRLLRREGQALARLQHPGIAAIYEAGRTEEGWHYFAMELVRGTPMSRYAREHHLGIPERLKLFQDVCDAVHYAHQRGVIHRDLKPSNILVADVGAVSDRDPTSTPGPSRSETAPTGQPKVLDFGLARITDPDAEYTQITEPGAFQGTLAYASPEQARGRPDAIDVRTDVYSLGVILYELLTDRLPYEVAGTTLSEAARIIQERAPRPLGAIHRALRGDLETIVGKALEKEPARRYATVSELISDITRYLRNEPIAARPAGTFYQLRKLAVRHKLPVILAGVLLLAIISFAVIAAVQAVRIRKERDNAVAARQHESEARTSAEEVSAFLEKLFEQSDPGAEDSTEPTVRDLLETGVARLDSDLADQPLVYARLAHVLGVVYNKLADFPRARGLLESAVEIRRRELGEAHPDVATSLIALANVLGRMGIPDRANDLLLQALQIRRVHYGEPHEEVAAALESVGARHFYHEDNAAAVDYFQQSLNMRRALGAEDRPEVAWALHNLGSALQRSGRLDEAEQALLAALEMRRRVDRPDSPSGGLGIGLTLEALAHVPYDRGDFEGAERYLAEQVDVFRRGLRPGHPMIAWGLLNYAFLVNKNRGPAEAEPIYREALAIRVAAYGEQHLEVAHTLCGLARMREAQHDLEAAIKLHQQALDIRRSAYGGNHDDVAHSLGALGKTYSQAGHFDEAEALLLEAEAIFTRNHGDLCKESALTVQALVALYEDHDRCALADQWQSTLAQIESQ